MLLIIMQKIDDGVQCSDGNRNQCHFIRKWFVHYNQPGYLMVMQDTQSEIAMEGTEMVKWNISGRVILYREATRKIIIVIPAVHETSITNVNL